MRWMRPPSARFDGLHEQWLSQGHSRMSRVLPGQVPCLPIIIRRNVQIRVRLQQARVPRLIRTSANVLLPAKSPTLRLADTLTAMGDVTRLLHQCGLGDAKAADELLPLVYEELRRLAATRMANERPDHTLGATALVHEAYLRLCGSETPAAWNGRGRFFGAAAEAMRRILVESARRKARVCHGGSFQRQELKPDGLASPLPSDDVVAISDALDRLCIVNSQASELVKLRFFAGLTNEEAAATLNISPRKASQIWAYARAWLLESMAPPPL